MDPELEQKTRKVSSFSGFSFQNWSVVENLEKRNFSVDTLYHDLEKRYSNWNQFRQIDIHE